MEVQVELTTNKWHTLRRYPDEAFNTAHRLIQTISKTGLSARIHGHKHSPVFGKGQIKPEDLPELNKWLDELEAERVKAC